MSYSVAIVDDERVTRESLLQYLDWKSLNLQVLFTATDGIDALNKLSAMPVDILLTDVRMPHMNGIELALNIRAKTPSCKIIFLSGYTDKEYLKSAISLKVEQYIEKPLDIEELTKVLQEIVHQLDCKNLPNSSSGFQLSSLAKASRLIKQEIAAELLCPQKGGYSFVHSRFYPLYFDWTQEGTFQVVCLHTHSHTILVETLYQVIEELQQKGITIDHMSSSFLEGNVALITSSFDISVLDLLKNDLERQLGEQLSIGVSPVHTSIHQLPEAWKQAKEACELWFYRKKGSIFTYGDLTECISTPEPSCNFKTLTMDFHSIQTAFQQLEKEKPTNIHTLKKYLYSLYMRMMELTVNYKYLSFEMFGEKTLEEIQELILYGMHVFGTLGNDSYDPKVKEVLHYILWNYSDMGLSIKMLADHAGISQNYLCAIFKQNTGTTINNFIMEVRIEKAKKLLSTTDLRLYEIAQKVGMADPNYFSSMFKSRCEITPSQYREKQVRETV